MTVMKEITSKELCDSLYNELTDMKSRILDLAGRMGEVRGPDSEHFKAHINHLNDLVNTIDWKLDIFTKVCPIGAGGFGREAESTVSVPQAEIEKEPISGGYVGG